MTDDRIKSLLQAASRAADRFKSPAWLSKLKARSKQRRMNGPEGWRWCLAEYARACERACRTIAENAIKPSPRAAMDFGELKRNVDLLDSQLAALPLEGARLLLFKRLVRLWELCKTIQDKMKLYEIKEAPGLKGLADAQKRGLADLAQALEVLDGRPRRGTELATAAKAGFSAAAGSVMESRANLGGAERFVDKIKAGEICRLFMEAADEGQQASQLVGDMIVRAVSAGRIVTVIAAAAVIMGQAAHAAAPIRIVVYHTNDIHGWIYPHSPGSKPQARGGMAALAGILNRESEYLLLDAGDWFTGTPEGGIDNGMEAVEFFNALGYDAVEVGNHDFDNGEEPLKKLAAKLKMPALGANVYRSSGHRVDYLRPSMMRDIGGVKVGVFGLITSHMSELAFPEHIADLRFNREIEEARKQVRDLKSKGADVIIAVTHVGFEDSRLAAYEGDKALAQNVPGIDLIVGGHSHTAIAKPYRDKVNGTSIVQAGYYLTQVGRVVLTVDPHTKKVAGVDGELIPLNIEEAGRDPDIAAIVSKYRDAADRSFAVIVGTAVAPLSRGYRQMKESSLGDWMTDCFREEEKADVAVMNPRGIRSDLAAGPVRLRALYEVMPFENYIKTIELTGRRLREVLQYGVSGKAGMIQVSGAQIQFSAGPGHPITRIEVNGAPLEDEKTYSLAVSDFMINGGDGYTTLAQGKARISPSRLMRDVLASCAGERPIQAPPSSRLREEN